MHGTELCFVAQSFVLWHRASFWHRNTLNLCNCRVPKLKNSACAEFLDSYAGFFWHRALSCGTELRFGIEIPLIYATAECQNLRIRLVPNSWDSLLWFCGTELEFVAQSFAFASGNSCFTNSLVQKHKNSACAEFLG